MLVGLLLTALTLAVLQLGVAIYVRNVVHDAAVEGAYHAALADTSLADGVGRTREVVRRAVGQAYPVEVRGHEAADEIEVTVLAAVPLVGVFGIPAGWEVTGRAPVESLD